MLQVEQRGRVGHGNHHSVAIHIAHGSGKRKIFDTLNFSALVLILAHLLDHKEHDGATELKVVLDILIRGAEDLNGCLIQRIIKAFSHTEREPGITSFHLALHSHLFGELAEGFLLGVILQLE